MEAAEGRRCAVADGETGMWCKGIVESNVALARPADEGARDVWPRLALPREPMLSRRLGIRGRTELVEAARSRVVSGGWSE